MKSSKKKSNSTNKSDSLKKRIIFGFSGFFLMMGGMIWNGYTYGFVFLVICTVSLIEYFDLMIASGKKPKYWYGLSLGVIFYILSFLINLEFIPSLYYLFLYPFFTLLFILKLYDKEEKTPFENVGLTLLGVVYVVVPFASLHMAVFINGVYHYQIILGIFFILWIHDIGAYFVGSRYGKNYLFPRISPSKSWEGSFGGALLAGIMVIPVSFYLEDLTYWQWSGIAFIIVVIGTHGDLVESMLKRSFQVKDSSGMLPGHGGFLDRFDNLLLSAPFIATFLKIF